MKRLFVDTDGVGDDVRALSMALQHPDVEVLGISTVAGCVSVQQATINVVRTLKVNNRMSVPIFKGSNGPLIRNDRILREKHFFGEDGIGDSPNEYPKVENDDHLKCQSDAAAIAITKIFSQHKEDITLVCIGPLTNIALALKLVPEFGYWPQRIVIMGGNIYATGNMQSDSTAEFNFGHDPEAASIVINEMRCPITVVPWETFVLESANMSIDFHSHLHLEIPLSRFFEMATRIGRKLLEKNGRQFGYCDEIAMAVAIDRAVIKKERHLLANVELYGQFTRGQIAIAWAEGVFETNGEKMSDIEFVLDYYIDRVTEMILGAIYRSEQLNYLI